LTGTTQEPIYYLQLLSYLPPRIKCNTIFLIHIDDVGFPIFIRMALQVQGVDRGLVSQRAGIPHVYMWASFHDVDSLRIEYRITWIFLDEDILTWYHIFVFISYTTSMKYILEYIYSRTAIPLKPGVFYRALQPNKVWFGRLRYS